MVVKDLAIVYLIIDLAFYNRIDTIFFYHVSFTAIQLMNSSFVKC